MKIINRMTGSASIQSVATTVLVIPSPADATAAFALPAPGSSRMEQKKFIVRASGYAAPGAGVTTNVTIGLYAAKTIPATPLTATNWTLLKASTARSYADATAPWQLEAKLIADSVSGKLHGSVEFCIINTLDAAAALTNVITSCNTATEPWMYFMIGVTFGTGDVGNKCVLAEFALGY